MNIKLEQYKIFNEAASTLSFSTAAKNLYISQSAVSQTIHNLEKELNTQLFIRQSKGVILTKEGKILHQHIAEALSLITNGENLITHQHNLTTGELAIGAGDTISEHYIMKYIVAFHKLYPYVTIRMVNRTSLEIIELLKTDESITIQECLQIHDIFVSKENDSHLYTPRELSNEPLILLEKTSNSRHFIDHHFASMGVLLKPTLELGSYDLALDASLNNLGKACVIKEFVQDKLQSKQIHEIKLNPPIPKRSIGYAYLTRKTLTAATLQFINLIEKEKNVRS